MLSETPLLSGWRLTADALPEELAPQDHHGGFSLPGAAELQAFADLLGGGEEEDAPQEQTGVPFSLPGMLPDGVQGCASLSREIDFGRLKGRRAVLEIDHLCGKGSILLGEKTLFSFGGGSGAGIDLTDALHLGRKQTLCIRFDDAKEAGVCGAVILRTTDDAEIGDVALSPDAARQTLDVSVRIRAGREGAFGVRAALAGTMDAADAPWRESRVYIRHAGEETLRFTLSMRAPCLRRADHMRRLYSSCSCMDTIKKTDGAAS